MSNEAGTNSWSTRWFLIVAAFAFVVVLFVFGGVCANPPVGSSPTLGNERSAAGLFPHFWNVFSPPRDASGFSERLRAATCGLWVAYALALGAVFRAPPADRGWTLRLVTTVAIVGQAVLLVLPPVFSGDLFRYGLLGRMVSHHGLNPYISTAADLAHDPLRPHASWNTVSANYGPAFIWLATATSWLSNGDVLATAVSFKTLAAVAHLATCWFVRDISRRLGTSDGLNATALYALNPVALIEGAGMGHNDALVAAYALGGISLALRGSPWLALTALLLAADVKGVAAALVALFAIRFVVDAREPRARALRLLGVLAWSSLFVVISWAPFWQGGQVFRAVSALLTSGRTTGEGATGWTRLVPFGLLLATSAVAASRGAFARVLNLSAVISLVFVVFVYPWHFAWYTIPPLALASSAPRTRPNVALLLAVLFVGLLFTLPYANVHPT